MDLLVRPARPEDPCVPLLFESAKPYYTAYAGSEQRALALLHARLRRARPRRQLRAAAASPCADGELVGVVAGFPVARRRPALAPLHPADAPAPAAVALAGHVPAPARRRRRRARARRSTPTTSTRSRSTARWRRRGIAQRLLDDAQRRRASAGLRAARARHRPAEPRAPARSTTPTASASARSAARPTTARRRALGGPGLRRLPQGAVEHRSSASATSATCPSVISGKNGSAIERAATSSQTGNSPSR